MRLATITNWAYGITVALSLASGAAMLLDHNAQKNERAAVQLRHRLSTGTGQLSDEIASLTGYAREFVMTGDPAYRVLYDRAASTADRREQQVEQFRASGGDPAEIASLEQALRWADTLEQQQKTAIAAYESGDRPAAVGILFGAEYVREQGLITSRFDEFRNRLNQRTDAAVTEAMRLSRWWSAASEIMLVFTMLLFLCVLYFVFKRRVLHPVVRLSDVVNRLAAQDFAAELPPVTQIDEIGDIASAIKLFRENGLERQRLEAEREVEQSRREMLGRMTQRLQGCDSAEELAELVTCFAPEIVPNHSGRLYVLDEKRNAIRQMCSWGEPGRSAVEFAVGDCWALRRGLPHYASGSKVDIPCAHIASADRDTTCLPLNAQREMLGLLYLERKPGLESTAPAVPSVFQFMLAENIGLALANLRLRESLRELAMVDPLTGLANRRGLIAALDREIEAARAKGTPLSALMIDIDHFKRFNDTFGHEAGDLVLERAASAFRNASREGDFVARFGGEEFLMLLPGLSAEDAARRAQLIRERIGSLDLMFDGKRLGTITCSIGTATAPLPVDFSELLDTADRALYAAKGQGRDRVVTGGSETATAPRRNVA